MQFGIEVRGEQEIAVGHRAAGIQPQRLAEVQHRFRSPPLLRQHTA